MIEHTGAQEGQGSQGGGGGLFDQPPPGTAGAYPNPGGYPSTGAYPSDALADEQPPIPPPVVEPYAFDFHTQNPDVVSVLICAYGQDGSPVALGGGVGVYTTLTEIIRHYPAAMPRPGEGDRKFLAIPVNSQGRRVDSLQRVFSISEFHSEVLALNEERRGSPAAAEPSPGGSTIDRLLGLIEQQVRADKEELTTLRTASMEAVKTAASEQVNNARGLQGEISSAYTEVMQLQRNVTEMNTQTVASQLEAAADRERARTDAYLQRLEAERQAERDRAAADLEKQREEHRMRLEEQRQAHELRLQEMRAEREAREAREREDRDRRDRLENEARERRETAERRAEERRLELENQRAREHEQALNRAELDRLNHQERLDKMILDERARDREVTELRLKAMQPAPGGVLSGLQNALALVAPFGITPQGIGEFVKSRIESGGGGGFGAELVRVVGTVAEKVVDVARINAETARTVAEAGEDPGVDEEDEEGLDEDLAPPPQQHQRTPIPDRPPAPDLGARRERETVPVGTPRTAAPIGEGGVPPGTARPQPSSPPPAGTAPARTAEDPLRGFPLDVLRRARAAVAEAVEKLDTAPQHEWQGILGQLWAQHQAVVDPYFRAIGLRQALIEAGGREDLVRDLLSVLAALGQLPAHYVRS